MLKNKILFYCKFNVTGNTFTIKLLKRLILFAAVKILECKIGSIKNKYMTFQHVTV